MLYKNIGEALQANAFTAFESLYGMEAFSFHPKVWSENVGWVRADSVCICSKMQFNILQKVNGVSFNGDHLVIESEQDGYKITISPSGKIRYTLLETLDEYAMEHWVDVLYPYYKGLFEKCR